MFQLLQRLRTLKKSVYVLKIPVYPYDTLQSINEELEYPADPGSKFQLLAIVTSLLGPLVPGFPIEI